ncbi:FecR domain-containing protein [Pedobacter panaciterrae]|uniref:FecR domain-containing protein n=1 Tax=Pedobacter panaciterrae TaxID=363849 RepID=A0ABU8NJP7_9SPHI
MDIFYTYKFDDFLDDPSFVHFVKGDRSEDAAVWTAWLDTSPENIAIYHQARTALVVMLSIAPVRDSHAAQLEIWDKIDKGIVTEEHVKRRSLRLNVFRYAAAAAVLVFAGLGWFFTAKVTIRTAFGEHRVVILPDGTKVKMNANSSLSYWRAWRWHNLRETWLDGEALFDVVHLKHNNSPVQDIERFAVHAGSTNIDVLGTVFNVKVRRNKLLVSLFRGRIQVSGAHQQTKPQVLKPGDVIRYEHQKFSRASISALSNKPLSWTNKLMETHGIAVAEIIENYEDTYGGQIVLDRQELLQKRIDGFISLNTKESTLYMLANLLNCSIEQRDSTYYFKSKISTLKP